MNPNTTDLLKNPVMVWDIFVRIFHWSLVICVLLNQLVLEAGSTVHRLTGYVAVVLVLARVVWGFVGSPYARFADFFPTPSRLILHVKALFQGQHLQYIGHNPLAALMMLGMMALVLSLGVTGWMQGTGAFFGEEWVIDLHELLADVLLVAACLHATAALVMGRLERVRLVRAMITGIKQTY